MNNLRLNLTIFFLLIFVSKIPYSVLAQENDSKIIAQEGRIFTFQNGNLSEPSQKNDFTHDTIIAFFGVFVGWLLSIIQPIVIEPIKRKLDKKRLTEILSKDVKNLIYQLNNKKDSLLQSYQKTTLQDVKESIQASPRDILRILVPMRLSTDIYNKNYGKILENFDDKNLFDFYLNIQDINSILNVVERTDGNSPYYPFLLMSYCIELEKCLSYGEKITI